MQSLNTMAVTVNEIPAELYDAKAIENSVLDVLSPGQVKQITINPSRFTNVKYEKGVSSNPKEVVSSGIEKRIGIIGLLKSFNITWNNKKTLMGFHGQWHENGAPRWRRRQFSFVGIQSFNGDIENDRNDWVILQFHPQARQDLLTTVSLLRQKKIEITKKNVAANMVYRDNWLFEFKNPDSEGVDTYKTWEREQEVNRKIEQLQDGHLEILMTAVFRGYKFFNQPALSGSAQGARAYLVSKTRMPNGYTDLRRILSDLDGAIEVDQFVQAIKNTKIKITDFEVIRADNGKVFLKFEEAIPKSVSEEEIALWIKTRMDKTDEYKVLASYIDELYKTSKTGAAKAKIGA
jgi:hypothetical protein